MSAQLAVEVGMTCGMTDRTAYRPCRPPATGHNNQRPATSDRLEVNVRVAADTTWSLVPMVVSDIFHR
jgi:hypothetical protein